MRANNEFVQEALLEFVEEIEVVQEVVRYFGIVDKQVVLEVVVNDFPQLRRTQTDALVGVAYARNATPPKGLRTRA